MAAPRAPASASSALRRLARWKLRYGGGEGPRRLELLRFLERRRLASARELERLHELLCFVLAYPDDRRVFRKAERMLDAFDRRSDLRRFRDELVDTGIAGTDIYYAFGAPTARWLARRWGRHLSVDWEATDADKLGRHLPLLALYAESPGLDEPPLETRSWLERLGGGLTDAKFLIQRMGSLGRGAALRDRIYDELEVMLRLRPGEDTPCRSRVRFSGSAFVAQTAPLRRQRPDLQAEAMRPPLGVRPVSAQKARELIDLARAAMVTRSRDLDAFAGADPDDVHLIDCGEGLELACLGVVPEKRMLLEAVYGYLILRNGVPIGYALASALWRSSELAFNIFETYRGAEAAQIYGRFVAAVRDMFGSDTFTIYPYQLGYGNEEGLRSGAWWFYYKLGFRPRDPTIEKLVLRELARRKRQPAYRSNRRTLQKLASKNVFFHLGPRRDDVIGLFPLNVVGLAVTEYVVGRFGTERERAARVCAEEVAGLLGSGDWRRLPPRERLAWQRLSPLIRLLPGVEDWPRADKEALAEVLRAKGGRREVDFVLRFDRHRRLRRALSGLGRRLRRRAG